MTQIRSAAPRARSHHHPPAIRRLGRCICIAALDTATQRVVRRFAVGRGPNGITYRAAVG
jgi:hypothetical protein